MNTSQRRILSTYRIQFHAGFTFRHALDVLDYLQELGISHLYASPILTARQGSQHGYDIVDFSALNPDIGSDQDYLLLIDGLTRRGMGIILDIVPNHMAVGTSDNDWWNSVLKFGETSPFAHYFDICWSDSHGPMKRVFLPVLGDPLESVLENRQLQVQFDWDGLYLVYFDRRLPLSHESEHYICKMVALEIVAAKADARQKYGELFGIVDGFDRFVQSGAFIAGTSSLIAGMLMRDDFLKNSTERIVSKLNSSMADVSHILSMQHYSLGRWTEDASRGNYRKFFDVSDLAGIKTERVEVFDDVHRRVLELMETSCVDGLRVDHPDGLFDPHAYFRRLREKANGRKKREQIAPYIFAEKILAGDEELPGDWPIDGTTGYDALNVICSLFVSYQAENELNRIWESKANSRMSFSHCSLEAKSQVLRELFNAEFNLLIDCCCKLDVASAFTRDRLESALRALLVSVPVYRTYIRNFEVSDADRAHLERARDKAISIDKDHKSEILFLVDLLIGNSTGGQVANAERLVFAGKFQQLTAPLTAKGVEDTAFYRYARLISLNEVGGEPDRFGISVEAAHSFFLRRQSCWRRSISTLSTHDTKRGEDGRIRVSVLSECAQKWEAAVAEWEILNASHRSTINGALVPDRATEYFLYQSLVGAWPLDGLDGQFDNFIQRTLEFCRKAIREAKLSTSWRRPNQDYERAVEIFVTKSLDGGSEFVQKMNSFVREIDDTARVHSISALLVKLTAPGIPDTYQGSENWNYDYVDPDNRRPVDFLALEQQHSDQKNTPSRFFEYKAIPFEAKQLFLARVLKARGKYADLFEQGNYFPLQIEGNHSEHIFAFARFVNSAAAIVVVPRLWMTLKTKGDPYSNEFWKDTRIKLPVDIEANCEWTNVLADESIIHRDQKFLASEIFRSIPFGVLVSS